MELKYVWIKDYKNLKNIGFNFNHSDKIKFELINDELLIEPYKSTMPSNFFGDKYQGITCIVGENGSGKTNLVEYINYSLSHVTNGGLHTYLKLEGLIILDNWIFVQEEIVIKNSSQLSAQGYEILRYDDAPLDKGQGEVKWYKMEVNKYIYYSPIFDFRAIPVHRNLINISTTYLTFEDYRNSMRTYVTHFDDTNQLTAHLDNEKMRDADFILNCNEVKQFIDNPPSRLRIRIDRTETNKLLKGKYVTDEEVVKNAKLKPINDLQRELNNLMFNLLDINLYEKYKSTKERSANSFYTVPIAIKKDVFYKLFILNHFQILLNNDIIFPTDFFRKFIYDEKYEPLSDPKLESQLKDSKNLIQKLVNAAKWIETTESYSPDYKEHDRDKYKIFGNLIVDIKIEDNKTLAKQIINLSNEITNEKLPIYFEFLEEYSSGQKQLLSLYSRFYWAKNKIVKSEKSEYGRKGEAIAIFIDEGEVALHPDWQRLFFNKIRKYLTLLFQDYKVQLILTTHSPFVLSDLPKESVLFLTKDNEGHTKQIELNQKNTFGANIYDLFTNSFFLKSTIGEFSKSKIKDIVDFYYKVNKAEEENSNLGILKEEYSTIQDEFKYTCQIVGDEIIQNVLKNHIDYIENMLLNDTDIDREIYELEKQIENLKSRK